MSRLRPPGASRPPVSNPYIVRFDENGDPIEPTAHTPADILAARKRHIEREAAYARKTARWLAWGVIFWAIIFLGYLGLSSAIARTNAAELRSQESFHAAPRSAHTSQAHGAH